MLGLLKDLKDYLKWQEIVTGNLVFRMHNSFTAAALLGCSLIISATQYVGSPIQCLGDAGISPEHLRVYTTFCWVNSTFTMPYNRGKGAPYAGILNDDGSEKKHYTYYQWVCFALFFQAVLCYAPKYIWDLLEGGLLSKLTMGMKIGICPEEEKEKKKNLIVNYILTHLKRHDRYVIQYWLCEVLCLANIVMQMFFMNKFFSGEFFSYGLKVLSLVETSQERRNDSLIFIFPRITKCTFYKYGASGSIENRDLMCILPLNIVNEKIYIFVWFWFIILLSLLSLLVLYRAVIIVCPCTRPRLLHFKNRMVPYEAIAILSRRTNIGDWWILYMLSYNIDPIIYSQLVMKVAKKISEKESAAIIVDQKIILSEKKNSFMFVNALSHSHSGD